MIKIFHFMNHARSYNIKNFNLHFIEFEIPFINEFENSPHFLKPKLNGFLNLNFQRQQNLL